MFRILYRMCLLSTICSTCALMVLVGMKWQQGVFQLGLSFIVGMGLMLFWWVVSVVSLWGVRSGRVQAVAKGWLLFLSIAVPYVLVDVAIGYAVIEKLSPLIAADPYVHHRLVADTASEISTGEFQYIQHVNSLGMRGDRLPSLQDASVFRILMLGDSFTMGKGVPDQDTFCQVLQNLVSEQQSVNGKQRFEILNAGVDSYSPVLCYLRLKELYSTLRPNLVILNFDVSDLLQEAAYRQVAEFDAGGDVLAVVGRAEDVAEAEKSFAKRLKAWIRQHLFLTRQVVYWLDLKNRDMRKLTVANTVEMINPDLLTHTLQGGASGGDSQWEDVFDSCIRIRDFCESRGTRFMMTIYPWGHQVSDREWRSGRQAFLPPGAVVSDTSRQRMVQFAKDSSIPLLDTYPAFRGWAGEDRLYFDRDMHWTRAGHKLMAAELLEFLKEQIVL